MTDFVPDTTWRETCPACGQAPRRVTPIVDRYGLRWPLAECGCGVHYQAQPLTAASAVRFYGEGHYRRWVERVTKLPNTPAQLQFEQRLYALCWRPKLQHVLRGPVLDYGGSTGAVSAILAPTLDRVVADYGDGAPVTPEQALAVAPGTYGTILCCQTLDHLPDPLETLQQFRRVARPGAGLFCDVVKRTATAYKLDHTTYYPSAASFIGLLERAGWVVQWLDAARDRRHYAAWSVTP